VNDQVRQEREYGRRRSADARTFAIEARASLRALREQTNANAAVAPTIIGESRILLDELDCLRVL
jgi:hypothetical protein